MIGSLSGTLTNMLGDTGTINVNGVGYEVSLSASVLSKQPEIGKKIDLVIYTDVKETSLILYGFATFVEREVFLLLKKAKGIGSKTALNIISGLGPEGVLSAIAQGKVFSLSQVPGVGRKTAERIIVELRERVSDLIQTPKSENNLDHQIPSLRESIEVSSIKGEQSKQGIFKPSSFTDAVLALEKLGFTQDRAQAAVKVAWEAVGHGKGRTIEAGELLREALSRL